MFENTIQNTDFAGSLADCMFRHISGSDYCGDNSLLCTLRVILPSRMKKDDTLNICCCEVNLDTNNDAKERWRDVNDILNLRNQFIVINAKYDVLFGNEEKAKERFNDNSIFENLHEFKDVPEFFKSKMMCRAFVDEKNNNSVVMILNMNMRKYHLMQSIIPKYFPWYFSRGRITQNEKNLLYSMQEKYQNKYIEVMALIASSQEFQAKKTSYAIVQFKRNMIEQQKRKSEQTIGMLNRDLNNLYSRISTTIRDIQNENLKLSGIMCQMNDDINADDELSQFIKNNNNIKIVETTDQCIKFIATGYLDIYDPECYATLSRNRNSWYWNQERYGRGYASPFHDRDARKLLMDSVFSDNPVFKLKTCGCYTLNIVRQECSANSRYAFPAEYKDYYPNPHHYHNSCLGSYRSAIYNCLKRSDIIGAISQCVTALHGVNVTESASFAYACQEIFDGNRACFEDKNGKCYTAVEAYQYLIDQNKEKQNEETQGEE